MTMRIRNTFSLLGAAAVLALAPGLPAQNNNPAGSDPEALDRLRRDQDEILRKAEHLQALMQRLMQRYEREKKPEQVQLLRDGIAHLERSGILREVASIRDDLAATALTEALRKQKTVVDELERLLNILLERKSIENLDQELKAVEEQAKNARQLQQRQEQLIASTRAATESKPGAVEQQLRETLSELRDAERREAERNAQQAGTRRPFLESALQRVQQLLQDQQRLEQGLRDEQQGRTPTARSREFDLGDLTQRARELQTEVRDQARQRALGEAATELEQQAAGTDAAALQQARERFEALLQDAPKQKAGPEGKARDPKWQELRERMRQTPAGTGASERQQLAELGAAGRELAEQRRQQAQRDNAAAADKLQKDAKALAGKLAEGQPPTEGGKPREGDPAKAVNEAAERLEQAGKQAQAGDEPAAQERTNEALGALERARSEFQKQNPDAQRQAGSMAAESTATAQELQNAPSAAEAEQQAAQALQQAKDALRAVEQGLEQARESQRPPTDATGEQAQQARQQLEAAQQTLQQALQQQNAGGAEEQKEAAARQEQLAAQAQQAAEAMQRAAEQGQLTPEQAAAAKQAMQSARQRMQQAAQKLQQGQQASASAEQQQAAQDLQQAMDGMQQSRPLGPEQQQQLQQQAAAQKQLTEDIVKLAKELQERENKEAERKVRQAAEASRKAQQAMDEGDREQTEARQEEARQKLEEAAEELEEEKDRYQDLRQEELLFRMREELTTFLATQQPITRQTLEAQQAQAGPDGLSRAARRKCNQLGEEEQQLAGKLEQLTAALTEEGNLVYLAVLKANLDDLRETARRLGGRNPDPGAFTTLLQQDIEKRTENLLQALERERQRRENERKQQQQQQQQQQKGQNRFNPQQQKLVSLIAELEMLKQLGTDTAKATDNLRTLVEARGDETIAEAEVALIERLAHRHGEITKLFQQIKAGVEQTLESMQQNEGEPGSTGR
jgi:hypothetical protein